MPETWGTRHVAKIDSSTITYDASGNKVEENVGGTIHEYVSAFGISAQMTGQTEGATNVPLPGGVQATYSAGSLVRFRYPDWQMTIRAESNPSTRAFTESLAFAPFGERYALKGAPFNVDSFTGMPDQIAADEYDFAAREEHNGQGRWTSPDPMRGTGNKYVYANNNPLSYIDPLGLETISIDIDGLEVATGTEGEPNDIQVVISESHPPVTIALDAPCGMGGNCPSGPDVPDDYVDRPSGLNPRIDADGKKKSRAELFNEWLQDIADRAVHGGNALGPGGRDEIHHFCGGANFFCYDLWSHFGPLLGDDKWAAAGTTYLYEKVGPNGEHLKYGITDNPDTRYSQEQLNGGRLKILDSGDRGDMLKLERDLHSTMPMGPEEGQEFYKDIQVGKGLKPPPYDPIE